MNTEDRDPIICPHCGGTGCHPWMNATCIHCHGTGELSADDTYDERYNITRYRATSAVL